MVTNRARLEIISIALKKFQNFLTRMAPLRVLIRVQAFRDQPCGELPRFQTSRIMYPTRSREMPSFSAID